jgi:hypothetical protein
MLSKNSFRAAGTKDKKRLRQRTLVILVRSLRKTGNEVLPFGMELVLVVQSFGSA